MVRWSRSSMDALLFLGRVLEACTNKPVFVWRRARGTRGPSGSSGWSTTRGAFGDRSRVERFFGSLKRRTRVLFNNINARRSRIASLDGMMNMSFVHYNGLRFQEGMGRVSSEVISLI